MSGKRKKLTLIVLLILSLLPGLAGCAGTQSVSPSPPPTATPSRTPTAVPTQQQPPTPTPTDTATPLPQTHLCSPLEGVELTELPQILSNPYQPPRPGYDDGHHGVDFAYYRFKDRVGIAGLPIHSVMDGWVAAISDLRMPYGYLVIIETPLEMLPPQWLAQIPIPTPESTIPPTTAMICPTPPTLQYDASRQSFYLLYAHMQEAPELKVRQPVRCGQTIGLVGTTGESVQEHLHMETRLGPSGARFENSMGFYGSQQNDTEAGLYCLWRVSGLFRLVNPMNLLTIQP